MDRMVYDLASELLDALVAALNLTRAGAPGLAVVHPGDQVPQYGCALAAVRVVTVPPDPGTRPPFEGWETTFEMVVDRCYTTPADNSMPPLPVLDSHARDSLDDAGAMRRAALCAWQREFPAPEQQRRFGVWTPRGPSGAIYGGAMQVIATGLGLVCGCEQDWGPEVDERIPPLPGDPRGTEQP